MTRWMMVAQALGLGYDQDLGDPIFMEWWVAAYLGLTTVNRFQKRITYDPTAAAVVQARAMTPTQFRNQYQQDPKPCD